MDTARPRNLQDHSNIRRIKLVLFLVRNHALPSRTRTILGIRISGTFANTAAICHANASRYFTAKCYANSSRHSRPDADNRHARN